MYVMHYRRSEIGIFTHLYEMTRAEMRAAKAGDTDDAWHRPVPAALAHKYVRAGGIHSTGLWLDDGRIRHAPADREGVA